MEAAEQDDDAEWFQRMVAEELEWRRREDGWEIQKEIESQLRERYGE